MLRFIVSALCAALVITAISAKPTTPKKMPPAAQEAKKLPDLEKLNPTNCGTIRQTGKNFVIEGHHVWEATGHVREDGSIFILWHMLSSGEPCPGEYEVAENDDKQLVLRGLWGYSNEGEVKDGKTINLPRPDTIYRVPPVEPEFK